MKKIENPHCKSTLKHDLYLFLKVLFALAILPLVVIIELTMTLTVFLGKILVAPTKNIIDFYKAMFGDD